MGDMDQDGENAADPAGLVVPSSANTKGAWTELIASAPHYTPGFWLHSLAHPGSVPADNLEYVLMDIGIGASGSEQVVLPNLGWWPNDSFATAAEMIYVPLAIGPGDRVSARFQTAEPSPRELWIYLHLASGLPTMPGGFSRAVTYGADETTSLGSAAQPFRAATDRVWFELATLIEPAKVAIIGYQGPPERVRFQWQLGIGVAGSEIPVGIRVHAKGESSRDDVAPSLWGPFAVDWPTGTRLAMKGAVHSNTFDGVNQHFTLTTFR